MIGVTGMQLRPSGQVASSHCIYCNRPGVLVQDALTPSRSHGYCVSKGGQKRRSETLTAFATAPEQQAEAVAEASTSQPQEAAAQQHKRTPGRQTYRPASFGELVNDATTAIRAAVDDGLTRLEVEFPPLPGNIDGKLRRHMHGCPLHVDRWHATDAPCPLHAGYKGSSDWFVDSNIQLAIAASRTVRLVICSHTGTATSTAFPGHQAGSSCGLTWHWRACSFGRRRGSACTLWCQMGASTTAPTKCEGGPKAPSLVHASVQEPLLAARLFVCRAGPGAKAVQVGIDGVLRADHEDAGDEACCLVWHAGSRQHWRARTASPWAT